MLREIDEPDTFVPDEEIYGSEEFKELKKQMLAIQPIRHGMIKRFFDKFKWQKKKRDLLLEIVEGSEEQAADILGPSGEFVPFKEAIPEIKTFLAEVEAREKQIQLKKEQEQLADGSGQTGQVELKQGTKMTIQNGKEVHEMIEEVVFDPEKFNPFDMQTLRKEKEREAIKPNSARKVFKVKKQ